MKAKFTLCRSRRVVSQLRFGDEAAQATAAPARGDELGVMPETTQARKNGQMFVGPAAYQFLRVEIVGGRGDRRRETKAT